MSDLIVEPKDQQGVINRICDCFIALICSVPDCMFARVVPRYEGDDPKATSMRMRCPLHDNGDFDEPTYYDEEGKEL